MAGRGNERRHLRLSDIPDNLLAAAGSYLAAPSRVMFAVAVSSSQSESKPSAAARTILGLAKWGALDFGDIERNLAARLTDDDVRDMLLCIDAANNLKKIRITGCVNITGKGLKPLTKSIVLEELDVSLVGLHENPNIEPKPKLSDAMIPILTVADAEGSSVRHVQLPKHFRDTKTSNAILDDFLQRYDETLNSRGCTCANCENVIEGTARCPWVFHSQNIYETFAGNSVLLGASMIIRRPLLMYGLQRNTCCKCMANICWGCQDDVDNGIVQLCTICERYYCAECAPARTECALCFNCICKECYGEMIVECPNCKDEICSHCMSTCISCGKKHCGSGICVGSVCRDGDCRKSFCFTCSEASKHIGVIGKCGGCGICVECRFSTCDKAGADACSDCKDMIQRQIVVSLEDNARLCRENDMLERENKRLRGEQP